MSMVSLRLSFHGLIGLMVFFALLPIARAVEGPHLSWATNQEATPPARTKQRLADQVEAVFQSELTLLLAAPSLPTDALWALQEMDRILPNPKIAAFLSDKKADTSEKDVFWPLLEPTAKRPHLPDDPGSGSRKIYHFLLSSIGEPPERAIALLTQFLSTRESGYLLAHQFLVLEWARQTGLPLTAELQAKRGEVLGWILAEQEQDKQFSDLYAERTAILLLFSPPKPPLAQTWVKTILAARKPSGGWGEFQTQLTYDGEHSILKHGTDHTRVLALLALRAYASSLKAQ
ncbi:hypothetical protein CCP4SC76_2020001 [Gammaproteobacteria bacterium]